MDVLKKLGTLWEGAIMGDGGGMEFPTEQEADEYAEENGISNPVITITESGTVLENPND